MKKSILLDASSAILLYKAGLINTVANEYILLTSQSVYTELTAYIREGAENFILLFKSKKIIISHGYKSCLLNIPLQGGERDTVLLFLSGEGEFVLIDDKKGGTYCKKNNIPYINALLLPRILWLAGKIDDKSRDAYTTRLVSIGRYSAAIREFARECSRDILYRFYP